MMFAEVSGIIALTFAVAWMLWIFFHEPVIEFFMAIWTSGQHEFQKGDHVVINGEKFEVLEVKSKTALKVKKSK